MKSKVPAIVRVAVFVNHHADLKLFLVATGIQVDPSRLNVVVALCAPLAAVQLRTEAITNEL